MTTFRAPRTRRWLAPEVVQTSSMDCGPAALTCLLEGFGIPVSYARLRDACQTDVDGTSIDTLETVANELGVQAEQVLVPADHVFLRGEPNLPALMVVRHSDGPAHFVVVWRRLGPWLQVMDPAVGRRWVRTEAFTSELVRHEMSVPATEWRAWVDTDEHARALRSRLAALGAGDAVCAELLAHARADTGWFSAGSLDAATRLVTQIVHAGGLAAGHQAVALLRAVIARTLESPGDIFAIVPPTYWSVVPDASNTDTSHQRLLVRGAVLLRLSRRSTSPSMETDRDALSPDLKAALTERAPNPLPVLWGYLAQDGLLTPAALGAAMLLASVATLAEGLLFRGIFDVGTLLSLGTQRLTAVVALLAFLALGMALRLPVAAESMRLGRRLDARLRMALLRKLPQLSDRYFQSRPVSDLAERSHAIHLTRQVPGMGIHFVQTVVELLLTLTGIIVLDPASAPLALFVTLVALAIPAIVQPAITERDLRARNHAGALGRFYLDALFGLVPIRAHRAQAAVRHQHQSLLVEWARASRRTIRLSLGAEVVQGVISTGLCAVLLFRHFMRADGATGADLLLVFWVLKLPALGQALSGLAHQYPMQRNILLRLLEPLSAPERATLPAGGESRQPDAAPTPSGAMRLTLEGGSVVVSGHVLLRELDLTIDAGEHVAIVGVSGAGKSTLVGLLLGWHRLAEGRLLVDGATLTEERLARLRRETAWVDPGVQLWNRSFLDNIGYSSPDADARRTAAAIDAASLRGVLQKLPEGLQTPLGEGGGLLSGGEGQRVRLARALAQTGVRLALLDEPFRGLDRSQRSQLLLDARRQWADATLICVTHDVGETRAFDRVLVVEDGRIVEDDSPARLADRPSRYRELLQAEQRVRERLWRSGAWRHIRVEQGAVGATVTAMDHDLLRGQRH